MFFRSFDSHNDDHRFTTLANHEAVLVSGGPADDLAQLGAGSQS